MQAVRQISLILVLCILCSLCACTAADGFYQSVYYDVFDTVTVISGYSKSSKSFNEGSSRAYEKLKYLHRLFDAYNEYQGLNNLATVNKNAGIAPVAVDKELLELISYSKELCESTSGAFDVSCGALTLLWKNAANADTPVPPDEESIKSASELSGFDAVELDFVKGTVYITKAGARFDLGAVAKGYACDVAVDILKNDGALSGASVSLGGNVYVFGVKSDGDKWQVAVRSPFEEGNLCTLSLADTSVVTSGDYQRFFMHGDKKYHHIIDPETGYPSERFSQVTVISESSALADALSTALFVMDYEEGMALAKEMNVQVIWVDREENVHTTDGVKGYLSGSEGF